MSIKAIFLDKDGTLIEDVPYNTDPARIRLLPGVIRGLTVLQNAGYLLVVISNQSGIALGYFSEPQLLQAMAHLRGLLAARGVHITASYYCPHAPGCCDCRKPQPGLLLRAAHQLDIALQDSWMIGDILDDIEAGHRAGCRAALIDNGNETQWLQNPWRSPDITSKDLASAATTILEQTTSYANRPSL